MQKLFPLLKPYKTHDLPVDEIHTIHVQEYGNRQGIPVVFLHGGPGSGCSPEHARFFNPDRYRIILFDQRGSGLSVPTGEITNNQTADLIDDMETIRKYLQIDQWLLFAGSWGATLGLLYTQTCSTRVTGLILRGVFLARQKDLDWFFGNSGVARIFPEAWDAFSAWLDEAEQKHIIEAYFSRLQSDDAKLHLPAARAWSAWENTVVTNGSVNQNSRVDENEVVANGLLAKTRIGVHYAKHHYFLSGNSILEHIDQLPDVPVSIVHGKYDLVCPFEGAWSLHQALPRSRLISVAGGHLASEPEMLAALVSETEGFLI